MGKQGRSKRKRKAKDMNSLRQKAGAGAETNAFVLGDSLDGLLDDGLAAMLEAAGGGQPVVQSIGGQDGSVQSAGDGLPQPRAKKLSKS